MKRDKRDDPACPCGRGPAYRTCCGRFIDGGEHAADAESLMRSRYSAYARERADYLLATWHPTTRPAALDLREDGQAPKWIGLDVLRHETRDADHAIVEFVARCRIGGRAQRLHEISSFVREDGRWYYVQAENDSK